MVKGTSDQVTSTQKIRLTFKVVVHRLLVYFEQLFISSSGLCRISTKSLFSLRFQMI